MTAEAEIIWNPDKERYGQNKSGNAVRTGHQMRHREAYSNYTQYAGISFILGSTIGLAAQPTNLIFGYLIYAGITLTLIASILSIGFRGLAGFARQHKFLRQETEKFKAGENILNLSSPSMQLDYHLTPRKFAICGALIAASSTMFWFGAQSFDHDPASPLRSTFSNNLSISLLLLGLLTLALSTLLAYFRNRNKNTMLEEEIRQEGISVFAKELRYAAQLSFFNPPRSIAIAGAFTATSGVALMHTGFWSAGTNTLLAGLACMLTGLILDSCSSHAIELQCITYPYRDEEITYANSSWHKFRSKAERLHTIRCSGKSITVISACVTGGDMLYQRLSNPGYTPSFSDPATLTFIASTAIFLMIMIYLEKGTRECNAANMGYAHWEPHHVRKTLFPEYKPPPPVASKRPT